MADLSDRLGRDDFSSRTLWNVGWRYLTRHLWQSLLMVLGITLGVAVVVAVDLANASASRAFDLSVDAVTGRATHQIVGGPQGLDETIYTRLRGAGIVEAAAPMVDAYVTSPQLDGRSVQLLGVDPFAEQPFRNYLSTSGTASAAELRDFMTKPGAVLVASDVAETYDLESGDHLDLSIGGRQRRVTIVGLLTPSDRLSRRALEGILLADIATAQELTDRLGRLDRIDLILPDGAPRVGQLQASLPPRARVQPVEARTGSTRQMTAAFRLNLTALSLLALIVGMFLIYNTMTFSVVQRRSLFGVLRSLGVTRREVFALVVSEALIVGTIGAGLGLALGLVMGQSAVRMVTRTINDLYFVLTVRQVAVPFVSLLRGGLLGVVATTAAAVPPAREAATVPPRSALSRSDLEDKARQGALQASIAGLALVLVGAGLLAIPSRSLLVSFGGTFLIIFGFALLTPSVTSGFMAVARPPLERALGVLGRMAPRDVRKSLSRTAIAVAALMVAMSVTIGISLMITSFRQTVVLWLSDALQGDIVISGPTGSSLQDVTPVDPRAEAIVKDHPHVIRVDLLRSVNVDAPRGPVAIEAGDSRDYGYGLRYLTADVSPQAAWDAVHQEGAVIVSEPLANRLDLSVSDALTLYTEEGLGAFPIAGIYYDYASTEGTAIMSLETYRRTWRDDTITALVADLAPHADPGQVARTLEADLASVQGLLARPNRTIREAALSVFDRTFAITDALQVLATVVAFIGVLSALLALQLEKQREFGVLRALGLTVRELRGLIFLETGLMGAVAGVLSMPAGFAVALVLIHVINRRSFGWTLQMVVTPAPFLQAIAISVLAALLAGIYPALRMGEMAPAEALRYE